MKMFAGILACLSTILGLLWVSSAFCSTLLITPAPNGGTVTSQPAGIICGSAGNICSKSVVTGSLISLTAEPDPGFVFKNWTLGGFNNTANPLVNTMPAAGVSISATFSPLYSLTVSARSVGNGGGNITSAQSGTSGAISCGTDIYRKLVCDTQFEESRVVTLTAKPDLYSVFAGWSGACSGNASACTVTMNAATTAVAHFVQGDLTTVVNPTWRKTAALTPNGADVPVTALAVNPHDHFMVFAGSNDGNIIKSVDGGVSWNVVNSGLANTTIKHIVVDPSNPQIVYAGTSKGMHKSTDGGMSWPAINNGVGSASYEVLSFAISASDSQTLYMGVLGANYYLVKSIDGGINWTPTGLTNKVESIQVDPSNRQNVYIVGNSTVMKSGDGGLSWSPANTGLEQNSIIRIVMVPSLPQQMYAEDSHGNIFSTSNGGTSWSLTGTISGLYSKPDFIIDPQNPQAMYAGTYNTVAASADGGANWQFIPNGLNLSNNVVVALDAEHHLLYAGGTDTGGVYKGERDINTIVESDALTWTHSGSAAWFSQYVTAHDGIDAMQSGAIGNGRSSSLMTTVTGPGTLTFWWKISSDPGDRLRLYVDGLVPAETGEISGEIDWVQKSLHLSDGVHTLEWAYSKDAASVAGSDAAWLDQVSYTRDPVHGICGYSNFTEVTSMPATDLCLGGVPTAVTYDAPSGSWKWGCNGSFGGLNASCSAFMTVPVSVYIMGEMGTITSTPPGISCINFQPSACGAYFRAGTNLRLSATPAWYSSFGGWVIYQDTFWVSYNDNPNYDITVAWNPGVPEEYYSGFFGKNNVRLLGHPETYSRIMDAYTAIGTPAVGTPAAIIQVQTDQFMEDLVFSSPQIVYLEGGKDAQFNAVSGVSTIQSLTVQDGSLVISDIAIR